jgi:hypothetical protein
MSCRFQTALDLFAISLKYRSVDVRDVRSSNGNHQHETVAEFSQQWQLTVSNKRLQNFKSDPAKRAGPDGIGRVDP